MKKVYTIYFNELPADAGDKPPECTVAVQNFIAEEFEKRLNQVQANGAPGVLADAWEGHWITRMEADKKGVFAEVKRCAAKWSVDPG